MLTTAPVRSPQFPKLKRYKLTPCCHQKQYKHVVEAPSKNSFKSHLSLNIYLFDKLYNTIHYNTVQRVYKLGSRKKPVTLIQILFPIKSHLNRHLIDHLVSLSHPAKFRMRIISILRKSLWYHHLSIYLLLLSRSFSDHHLRCGGWLNLEFSKREKHSGWAIKTIYKK